SDDGSRKRLFSADCGSFSHQRSDSPGINDGNQRSLDQIRLDVDDPSDQSRRKKFRNLKNYERYCYRCP
ncbi:hypothetical protein, partial [Escherichia coli]|uniref:hypothetical protein n=1 Tax=Escherichia coli TaxID=562 RepID=UPI001C59DE83